MLTSWRLVLFRKRAAAKQCIERYYTQLTEGCGAAECQNEFCRSSAQFSQRDLPKDQAAVRAMHLMRDYGTTKLCEDDQACKKAKPEQTDTHTPAPPSGTSPDKSHAPSTSFGASAGHSKDADTSANPGEPLKQSVRFII